MKMLATIFVLMPTLVFAETNVKIMRVPDGGIEPQVIVKDGIVHLIYFKGNDAHGDVFYVRNDDAPVRVNSDAGSALAIGGVRGARFSIGKSGRIHVVWNASRGSELFYSRSSENGFEPQRNLAGEHGMPDGGAAIAADDDGNVYVAWHAPIRKDGDEASRRVWLARSVDDGKNFKSEISISTDTGACACCATAASVDRVGRIKILYRAATEKIHRDMYLLTSTDRGETFSSEKIDEWEIGQCTMSTASIAEDAIAFESHGQILMRLHDQLIPAPQKGKNRKHPSLATNARGETLLAWTEGTSWNKGGSIAWRVFDSNGKAMGDSNGHADGLPVWGWVAAYAKPDGSFVVIY